HAAPSRSVPVLDQAAEVTARAHDGQGFRRSVRDPLPALHDTAEPPTRCLPCPASSSTLSWIPPGRPWTDWSWRPGEAKPRSGGVLMNSPFARASRRSVLRTGVAGLIGAGTLPVGPWPASGGEQDRDRPHGEVTPVKALVFDVFGTVVDWRTSVASEVRELARRKGLNVDAEGVADAWRAGSGPSMNRVR